MQTDSTNADIKPNSERSEAERQERTEWRYVETPHSAKVDCGNMEVYPHWAGLLDAEEIRATMRQIVSEHNQHTKIVEAARFALTTPGMIKGREQLQAAVDTALNPKG